MIDFDVVDRKILRNLQSDASLPVREIAERAGVSQAACWRRINQFRELGVIQKQVTILDRRLLGYDIAAFLRVTLTRLTHECLQEFEQKALLLPELQELQLISNENAYRMRVVLKSISDYDMFFRYKLSKLPYIQHIIASFVVSEPKYTFDLPI